MKMKKLAFWGCLALSWSLAASGLWAAQLGSEAQVVIPGSAQQIISVKYSRLQDPMVQPILQQVMPGGIARINAIITQAGLRPRDVRRVDFATFSLRKGLGMITVLEGNFLHFDRARFFQPTKKQPRPPHFLGVNYYTTGGWDVYLPDNTTLVAGSLPELRQSIRAEQSAIPNLEANDRMSSLISGTQDTDAWSVLDASGARNVMMSLAGAQGKLGALLGNQFRGARYTLDFSDGVKLNLEVVARDSMAAATLSTGLQAALLYRAASEPNPMLKNLLGQVQVDSAGRHVFLQVSSPENQLAEIVNSPLFHSIMR